MKYELILTGKFKKSLKLARKRGLDISLLEDVVTMLQNNIPLEEKYRDHELKGKYQGFRECHIQPEQEQEIENLNIYAGLRHLVKWFDNTLLNAFV